MKTKAVLFIVLPCILFIFLGCSDPKDPPEPVLNITLKDATNVTETSFTANWNVSRTVIKTTNVKVSLNSDFSNVVQTITLSNPAAKSQLIEGLTGATKYYYKISVTAENNDTGSGSSDVRTSFKTEDIQVTSSEDIEIRGSLSYLENNKEAMPLVICMGHFQLSNLWKGEDVFYDLIAQGYACCTFNYRGHGNSGSWPIFEIVTLDDLEEFASLYARNDFFEIYRYLKSHPRIDSSRIALMGGSLGANESMVGNNWSGVKCSIGLCASRLGIEEGGILQNVFFIASETDCNSYVCFKDEAEFLYDLSEQPKKIMIIPGGAHGLDMLSDADVGKEILNWINARIED